MSTDIVDIVDRAVSSSLDPVMERRAAIEERLGKLRAASDAGDESLRPDIVEEVESLRQNLEKCDRLVVSKNQEISGLNARLRAKDETIAELGEQIDRLESELASREPTQFEKSTPVGEDFPKVEATDLLNRLKAQRRRSKADLGDIEALLEILNSLSGVGGL